MWGIDNAEEMKPVQVGEEEDKEEEEQAEQKILDLISTVLHGDSTKEILPYLKLNEAGNTEEQVYHSEGLLILLATSQQTDVTIVQRAPLWPL